MKKLILAGLFLSSVFSFSASYALIACSSDVVFARPLAAGACPTGKKAMITTVKCLKPGGIKAVGWKVLCR